MKNEWMLLVGMYFPTQKVCYQNCEEGWAWNIVNKQGLFGNADIWILLLIKLKQIYSIY